MPVDAFNPGAVLGWADRSVNYCRRVYQLLLRHVLRRLPAEFAHDSAIGVLRVGSRLPTGLMGRLRDRTDPVLRTHAFGLEFDSPIGLAAGFDKNAVAFPALRALGFGFVEVGTITADAQPGNPRPRLFRLPQDRALVNRMGFNNDGAATVARRLRRLRAAHPGALVGVNLGKTRRVAMDDVVHDYVRGARLLAEHGDYLVVNVSSPNTPGLRQLQSDPVLEQLLTAVRGVRPATPLLLKVSADLGTGEIGHVADLANRGLVDGVIATNTSSEREGLRTPAAEVAALGSGGLSGPPLRARSLGVLRQLRASTGPGTVLVSAGGVDSADDVLERILAGATLVQAYTGFVYGGPAWVRRLNRQLAVLLRARGFAGVNDAVGRG